MQINNVKIYDLPEAIVASGYPMIVDYNADEMKWQAENLQYWLDHNMLKIKEVLDRKVEINFEEFTPFEKGCVFCGKEPARAMKAFGGLRCCCAHAHQMERYSYVKALTRYSPNKIELDESGEFAWIILRDRKEDDIAKVKISCEDILKVCDIKFYLSHGYAKSNEKGFLHKLIYPEYFLVDHINRDRLDCRRENLRPATQHQNLMNKTKTKHGTNEIMGVQWRTSRSKWRSYITLNGKQMCLGHFENKEDAIKARLNAEIKYFQEFAPQNDLAKKYGIINPYIVEDSRRKYNLGDALKHYNRICKLASAPSNSGHLNAITGILVAFDVSATNAWMIQAERYHFLQIVSSQSKMHCLKKMTLAESFRFHDKVFENGQELLKNIALYVDGGTTIDEEELIYNCPMGLELTCRMTTNYLQLKNIYHQRKNHRLQEWRDFCKWIETLPLAKELIVGEVK